MTTTGVAASVVFSATAHAAPHTVQAAGGLNVRSGPGLNTRVLGNLPSGTRIDTTGSARNGFVPINFRGQQAWVSEAFLRPGGPDAPRAAITDESSTAYTRAPLNVRTGAGLNFRVVTTLPRGTRVQTTGVTANGYTQIRHAGVRRWVSSQYLSADAPSGSTAPGPVVGTPPAPSLPRVTGTKYATAPLILRSSSRDPHVNHGTVPKGTPLPVTGRVENGRAEVVRNGAVRWVTAQYLTSTPPVQNQQSLPGLTPNSQRLLAQIQANFPEARTIYGVRQDPLPDHPSGRALDIMTYRDTALGSRVASWAQANAASLNIDYIIWDQRIWSVARSGEGWRFMADRGSDTANHKDHVHITVR